MSKNMKIKSCIIITILVIIIAISTIVSAAETENYSVGMSLTSNSKLKEGDTVTVTVNLTSINAGDGVGGISGRLKYDTNVFEAISSTSITMTNGWSPSYAASSNRVSFLKNSDEKAKQPEAVAVINFKVKSSISVDSTTITLEDISASSNIANVGGTGDITVNNISVTISKEKDATSTTDPTPKPTNPTNPGTTTNNNGNNKTTNNTIKDNTITKTNKLPKTGLEQYGFIAIIIVAIVAIFSYVLYKKIAKDVK